LAPMSRSVEPSSAPAKQVCAAQALCRSITTVAPSEVVAPIALPPATGHAVNVVPQSCTPARCRLSPRSSSGVYGLSRHPAGCKGVPSAPMMCRLPLAGAQTSNKSSRALVNQVGVGVPRAMIKLQNRESGVRSQESRGVFRLPTPVSRLCSYVSSSSNSTVKVTRMTGASASGTLTLPGRAIDKDIVHRSGGVRFGRAAGTVSC